MISVLRVMSILLVECAPGYVPGLMFIRMQDELSALLNGHRVDLVVPEFLNRRIRMQVFAESEEIYARR